MISQLINNKSNILIISKYFLLELFEKKEEKKINSIKTHKNVRIKELSKSNKAN